MRKPIQIVLAAVLLAASAGALLAQDDPQFITPEDFERVVNFDATIESIAKLVEAEAFDQIDVERFYILEGSVASVQVYDPNPETFQATIELVSSEWVGLEEIEVYHILILLEGPRYADRVFERLPRDPGPDVIRTNQELTVVGPYVGLFTLDQVGEVAVIAAVELR